jgi:hypothetical protein
MAADRFDEAIDIAVASALLSHDQRDFLRQLDEFDLDWTSDLVGSVRSTLARYKEELSTNAYAKRLSTGARPNKLLQSDWDAKERYQRLRESLEKLDALGDQLSKRAAQGEGFRFEQLNVALEARDIEHDLRATVTSPSQEQPHLDASDYTLCAAWKQQSISNTSATSLTDLVSLVGDFEAHRLSSARAAELAARKYYEALGLQVKDISITQLREGNDWKYFDLLVDGVPVDVKNARRSFSNPDSYVEHAVPAFKLTRAGTEVSIAGVLSDYRPHLSDSGALVCNSTILGEAKLSDLERLFSWIRHRYGEFLDLDQVWKPNYQPGWAFEYRAAHYPRRHAATQRIADLIRRATRAGFKPEALSGWLSTLHVEPHDPTLPLENRDIIADIQDLARNATVSRPSLYLYSLARLAQSIIQKDPPGHVESRIRRSVFGLASLSFSGKPLGLDDPQQYVRKIIDALSTVHRALVQRGIALTAFKLTHPEILRGRTAANQWITLLAYCGGWRQEPFKVKCGATPLIFGKNAPCSTCGYLCCQECGFCSSGCGDMPQRQAKVAAGYRERHSHER